MKKNKYSRLSDIKAEIKDNSLKKQLENAFGGENIKTDIVYLSLNKIVAKDVKVIPLLDYEEKRDDYIEAWNSVKDILLICGGKTHA